MKVVQINCYASGSTGNIAKAIHRRLRAMGYESTIFYEVGTPTEPNMYRIGNYFELHAHAVLSRYLGKQGYFSHLPTYKLIQRLKKLNPDIIHLHNLHGSYLNLPMLFGYLKKATGKVIITLHDCWLFTGKCPHFTVAGCYRWKESCGNCPQLARGSRSKVDTTTQCLADKKKWLFGFGDRLRVIAVSHWLRDTARESFLSQYSIETIYNGVNTDIFKPVDGAEVRRKYGIGNRFMILGVAPVWDKNKGLNEFIQLATRLQEDEVIVLVGMTAEQVKAMPPNIIGIVHTQNQKELAALYSAANVFVNTSREETFGLVTAEAMACGTPVIVYDSTACAEIVEPECGFVLSTQHPEQLYQYIERLKVNPFRLEKHGSYPVDNMVQQYVSLYKEVVK